MKANGSPRVVKLAHSKQRRMHELLEKNSEGTITPREKEKLAQLVAQAERLMVDNAKRLAKFAQREAKGRDGCGTPVTVWLHADAAER